LNLSGEGVKPLPFKGVKLYIGIPTRGVTTSQFCRSLVGTVSALALSGIESEVHYCQMSCHVDMGRNTILAKFMHTDCTHLLFIDDDMGWEPESVFAILRQDVELVAGVGPKKTEDGEEYCCHLNVDPEGYPIMLGELLSASDVGAAFVLMKRAAVERLINKFPDLRCRAVDMEYGYHFFENEYTQNTFRTEDYTFCKRYREAGGDILVYPDISFLHTGQKDYQGNYHKFLSKNSAEESSDFKNAVHYSIVIVAYKALESLTKCLESLFENAPLARSEIVVIDNSTEPVGIPVELWEKLKEKYYCRYRKSENVGFSEGCNIGARLSTGRYLVFVNPDTVVYPGWAMALQAKFLQDPSVGAVGPLSNFVCGLQNIVTFAHTAKYADEVAGIPWKDVAKEIYSCGMAMGVETKLLIGFFLMVSRSAWDKVGEFDKALKLGCDDLDYSLRLRDAGYKLMVSPNVFVYHEGHKSFLSDTETSSGLHKETVEVYRAKLHKKYGEHVPSSTELWGCEIFPTSFSAAEIMGAVI